MRVTIREAEPGDLEAIVRLHEEDELGRHGDAWLPETEPAYREAFAAIRASAGSTLYVAEAEGRVVGTFQLTVIPNLTGRGALRGKIESVKVAAALRSRGVGGRMMAFVEDVARAKGVRLLELSSNKSRADAHCFYERLGFARSHEGFKKAL